MSSNPTTRPHPASHSPSSYLPSNRALPPAASRARSGSVAAFPPPSSSSPSSYARPGLHKSVSTTNLSASVSSGSVRYYGNRSNPNLASAPSAYTSLPSSSTSTSTTAMQTASASAAPSTGPAHHGDDRLQTWISDQVTRLAVEDLGISFSPSSLVRREEEEREEEMLFSASTYVPTALRNYNHNQNMGRGRARAASSATATTVQPVKGTGSASDEWYWRSSSHSHSPTPHPHPTPSSNSALQPSPSPTALTHPTTPTHPTPSPSTSDEFDPRVHGVAYHHRTPSRALVEDVREREGGTARSDSPLLGYVEEEDEDEYDGAGGVARQQVKGGGAMREGVVGGMEMEMEGEGVENREGRDGERIERNEEEDVDGRLKHRRSKSSEETVEGEYDFPRTPGVEDAAGGVWFGRMELRDQELDEEEEEGKENVDESAKETPVYSPSVKPLNLVKKNSVKGRTVSDSSASTATPILPSHTPPQPTSTSTPPQPTLGRTRAPSSARDRPVTVTHGRQRSGTVNNKAPSPSPSSSFVTPSFAGVSTPPSLRSPNLGYATPAFLSTSPSQSFLATSPSQGQGQVYGRSTSPSSPSRSSPSRSPMLSGYSSMSSLRSIASLGSVGNTGSVAKGRRSRSGSVSSSLSLDPTAGVDQSLSRKPSLAKKPSFGAVREVCEEEGGDVDEYDFGEEVDYGKEVGTGTDGGEGKEEGRDGERGRDRSASASTVASFRTAKTDVGGEGGVFSDDEMSGAPHSTCVPGESAEDEARKDVNENEEVDEEVEEDEQKTAENPVVVPASTPSPVELTTPTQPLPPPPISRMRSQSASVVRPSAGVGVKPVRSGGAPSHVVVGGGHGHGYSQSVSYASPSVFTPAAFGALRAPAGLEVGPAIPSAASTLPPEATTPPAPAPPGAPTRASVGLGLGPGVGVRIQTRSRAGSVAAGAALQTPPLSAGLVAPPPSAASLLCLDAQSHSRSHSRSQSQLGLGIEGLVTPPGTLGSVSGLESVNAETPARHAVYIVDGEEVRRRLGELVARGEMGDQSESETGRKGGDGWDEGNRKTVMLRDYREEEEGDPVLPVGDWVVPLRAQKVPEEEGGEAEGEGDKTVTMETGAAPEGSLEWAAGMMTEEEVEEMEIGMGIGITVAGIGIEERGVDREDEEERREAGRVKTVPNTPPSLPSLELPSPSLPISSLRSSVEFTGSALQAPPNPPHSSSQSVSEVSSTSLLPKPSNSNTSAGGFYATPYASSSQIYLGPGGGSREGSGSRSRSEGGSKEGSVHSRGSSASSKRSKELGSVSAAAVATFPKNDRAAQGSGNAKRDSAASLSITPSPAALASRRTSRPVPAAQGHGQQVSVSGASSLRSPMSDVFQYLNNSPHEHAQSLLPSPTISIFSASASAHNSFSATGSISSATSYRASTDGPPPKRPPPAPPLDLGLSTEEVRALRARGIRSPGARVTAFGAGEGGGEGYRMSFGKGPPGPGVSGGEAGGHGGRDGGVEPGERDWGGEKGGGGGMQLGLGGGFKFPAAAPQAVMSAPVVKEERGSYFGVYGRRASPLGTAPPQVGEEEDGELPAVGDVDAGGRGEEDEEVDKEIEAVQREMAGIIFEKQRRSMAVSSEHVLDQSFEAYSHRPMDSSSSPLDPTHPHEVQSHRPMDSVLDPMHQVTAAPSQRQMESSRGVDPFDYYHGQDDDAYDDAFDVDAELGPDFAREMGLTMGVPEEDTLKGHEPATYRTQRPGLSVVVPEHYPPQSFNSTSPAVRSRGPSPLELGPRQNGLNVEVDDMSRWSVASSLVLGKESLDFPSLPVPQPSVASKRSSDSSKHSKMSSASSSSFFRRSHTKSTPSGSSKPSTLQKDDFFEDDSVDGHDQEMYGVAGNMVVVPPQPSSSFSPDSPEGGKPQSPPKRSLSKWRKRDRGNSVASTSLAPTMSKSAPASPTKRRSHTVSAKDAPREHLTVTKEGEQPVQREGKRGRLASFFSKIAKREVEEVQHPPAPWTLSPQIPTPGSSNSGHGSPLLHPSRARASTTSAADGDVRGVEGHWEGLAPVGRTSPAKEGVPPVPALPPLHTLPRMASRGSLRGVAVLNNASHSNGNGPPSSYSPVQTPHSQSPVQTPYSPVQQYSNSPFGGSPRTSYVPTPVNGSSPRTSYVPSPIIPPSHHSAAPSPVNSRRTTMTSNSNLSNGLQPAYPSELDLGFGPDESVPPTPNSIVSFASGASSGQAILRTSRSAGNLLAMASPGLEPASPPPPPVPPKDDDYSPLVPPQNQNQSLKSAAAGGVYVPGYEWPPSEPLPASAFVPGGGRDEYVQLGRDSREEKKDGVLGRLRLKSSPSLGNLHHVKEAREREKEGKGGLRGFVARMGGRT